LSAARITYANVAQTIACFEPVVMVVQADEVEAARQLLGHEVRVEVMALDDAWMRDIGPTFLLSDAGGLAGVDWRFNAWGKPEWAHRNDAAVAKTIIERVEARYFAAPFVLEGGSIHVDGVGTLLTTEQCLLNPNRNSGASGPQIEGWLRSYLGVTNFIWLGEGLRGDHTDGHVDNVACFVAPGVVLVLGSSDPGDPDYEVMQANLEILRSARDAGGKPLAVHVVEQPPPRLLGSERLAQSYVNFYIANGGVVMPSFDAPAHDAAALAVVGELFPSREVVQVPALDLIPGGGGIHCITQQQPLAERGRGGGRR
jgi:agmatine deiminase